jgi:pyruvate-formate lyase-activating enzyme
MSRIPINVKRIQTWGSLYYNTVQHSFSYRENEPRSSEPYANIPVVLNIVITRCCNMRCRHCVAKDFAGIEKEDIILSVDMINWINSSPFMVIVLTGGEPLMPPYDIVSINLINSIKDRGIILDTTVHFCLVLTFSHFSRKIELWCVSLWIQSIRKRKSS